LTAIAGFIHTDGRVWIGGDSAGSCGPDLTLRADPKIFRNGDFLFGFTSSFRMGQVLRYKFQPPERHDQEIFSYMVTTFVDAVRACLKEAGMASKDKEVESGGTFLIGYQGRLFLIDGDYQVEEPLDGYDACGSGHALARGALFATHGMEPAARITVALQAAERHNCMVRGPFVVESI
jgi:ATP-dependent protease HslVU (ClpYQ) peptidase subunit